MNKNLTAIISYANNKYSPYLFKNAEKYNFSRIFY